MSTGWPDWRARAEIEIRALVHRYNAVGDAGRVDEFVDLFVPDAVFVVTGLAEPFVGRDGIQKMVREANDDLRSWEHEGPLHLRHFTSTHQVDFDAPTEARGRVYYQCLMPHGLDHWGRYTDQYRMVDGTWRFAARTEARDGMVAGGWCHHLWGPNGTRTASRVNEGESR